MNGTNDGASADIILRSTDNGYLRTSKAMLSDASELFKTMLSLPQPQAPNQEFIHDGLAVIPIDADTSLLRNLLSFCNPPEMVRLPELQRAAMKYQMYEVAKRILRERTRGIPDTIPPIMLASIEQKIGQNNDARLAAVFTMLFPEDNSDDVVDMGLITKAQVDSLLAYRRNCVAAAVKVARPDHNHFTWMSEAWTRSNWFKGDEHDYRCNKGGNIYIANTQGKWMMRYWWREYIDAAKAELSKRPCGSAVLSGAIFERALKEGSQCKKCSPDLGRQLGEFAALFAGEIDKAVSSVSAYKYFT